MSLAPFVRTMGRGPSRGRSLTQEEAAEAMRLILSGAAAPEAVGALLMLMRYRGETAGEIAGFVTALREVLPPWPGIAPAVDWPSYAAGRTRGLPWFLLSARLIAQAGLPVLIHGQNSHQATRASVRDALPLAGIAEARDMSDAAALIARDGIAYLPLSAFSPQAEALLRLRDVLGLRSAVNTALRCLNPAGAECSVQGVFHPPYRGLQTDAGTLLQQPRQCVIKGGGGEFERHPTKEVELHLQQAGETHLLTAPALLDETRRLADEHEPSAIAALWAGTLQDPFAEAVVTGTAAIALLTTGRVKTLDAAQAEARRLWEARVQPARTKS